MANFVQGTTLSSSGLSGAAVQWTTAAHQSLATPIVAEGDPTTSDLLQQALNEVSFDTGGGVSYMEHSGGDLVYVQEDGKLVSLDSMIASGDIAVMSVPPTAGDVCGGDQHVAVTMDVGRVLHKSENTDAICAFMPTDPDIVNVTSAAPLTYSNTIDDVYSANDVNTSQAACPVEVDNVKSLASVNNGGDVPSTAALGTSRNPIRIVQRGNHYTAMQHLTPDQLTQIIHVIQEQQQIAQTKNPSSSGSAILYNPDAGSQVVYRITPSSVSTVESDVVDGAVVQMVSAADHGHQKRVVHKRKKGEDVDRVIGSELSRQEKEERKKHRPRTRSGRVSKPPQYMVKDYKHIHPVDYDEDYDDSDGGYSDFKQSGDEADNEDQHADRSGHWKHNKCETCEKRYIGTAGLARHYRLNPSHGKMPSEHTQSSVAVTTLDCSSDGLGLQDVPARELHSTDQDASLTSLPNDRGHPTAVKKRGRGRPPVYKLSDKRRAQLKEVVKRCSTEDLLQVALPKLSRVASLWDVLSARLPKGKKSASDVCQILMDYNEFRCQLKSVCEERLSLVKSEHDEAGPSNTLSSLPSTSTCQAADMELAASHVQTDRVTRKYYEMTSSDVADSLGLVVGRYEYVDRQQDTSVNSSITEMSPDGSSSADLSLCLPVEVDTSATLLADDSQDDNGRTETVLGNTADTSCKKLTDELVADGAERLQPDHGMRDIELVGSGCTELTDTVTDDQNTDLASSGTIDSQVMTAESNAIQHSDADSSVCSNINGSSVLNDVGITDVSEADGTNVLTLASEMSAASDGFCRPAASERVCQAGDVSLVPETTTQCNMQSNDGTVGQCNSSSDTVPLSSTADDLDGLLNVISSM